MPLESATCRNCGKGLHRNTEPDTAWFHDDTGEHTCEPLTVGEPAEQDQSDA